MTELSVVRRFEAVSFQSYPAQSTYYDGTWAVRLTKNHTAKRLNSINALDPRDTHDLVERLEAVKSRFEKYEKPIVFRQTPLMPPALGQHLIESGWVEFDETIIMTRALNDEVGEGLIAGGSIANGPIVVKSEPDIPRWVDAIIGLGEEQECNRQRLTEILENMTIPIGLFAERDQQGGFVAALRGVVHSDLLGLFELATRSDMRQQGLASKILETALAFGRMNNAKTAWLQVVASNEPAIKLYQKSGFVERYRYSYWRPGDA